MPLALDQTGAYLEETGMDLDSYWHIYQQHRTDLLQERGGLVADHPAPVATTWSLSFKLVEEKNLAAADLLRMCAFLSPDAIAEEILTVGASSGSILKLAHHIGQVVMGFARVSVTNDKGSMFGDGQSVCGCKWRTNVTASVTHNLGVVFKPEQEFFFELATKWLPDTRGFARLETRNPPKNGAASNFKEVNAINRGCNHHSSCLS